MAGPSLQHQESHVYMRDFGGCKWALFQWFDFQRRLRFLSGNKSKGLEQFPFLSKDGDSTDMDSDSSTTPKHSSRKKSSGKSKSLLKSFIPKKFYRKQDQKQKILPLSPQLLRTISIHHLEPKNSKPSDTSSNSRGSFHGYVYTATNSSSRSENDSLLQRHLNVIQEEGISRSSSVLSETHPDLKSASTSNLDATGNTKNYKNRPEVSKSFKQMITMDSVLHKIPYGQKLPEYSKFSSNMNLFRSVSVNYDRRVPHQVMKRSRSLSDSVGLYSQLLESLSRESTQKTTQTGARVATVQSTKENTMANNTSQEKDLESMLSDAELTADEHIEKQNSAAFSLQETDSISSPSESVVDDMRLTKEEFLKESKDATHALSIGIESISIAFMQDAAEGVGSGNQTLERSKECEDLDLVKEMEEFSTVQDEAGPPASYYDETLSFHESLVSVLDSEFFNDPIPSKIQNFKDSNNVSGPNLEDLDDFNTFGKTANNVLAKFDILPSQLVQGNGAELDNLKDLFENFGFGDGDFLEIINVLLQEVCQENDKIPFGYNLTNFDCDFGGFDYDENMSLDQNILYALTHEALRDNLKKYLGNGTLVTSYSILPTSDSLQNGLTKDLWKKLSCYVNPEICFSGRNFFVGIMTSSSLQNDGWLNYPTEREHLGVELGDEIFDSIIDELVCEL